MVAIKDEHSLRWVTALISHSCNFPKLLLAEMFCDRMKWRLLVLVQEIRVCSSVQKNSNSLAPTCHVCKVEG